MTIREATPADTDRLVAMATRFLASTAYGSLFQPDADRLAGLVETSRTLGVIFVAEVDAHVAGMIAWAALDHPLGGRYGDELAWWVEPEYRHTLLGAKLLRRSEGWGRELGLRFLKVSAPTDSTIGEFYARLEYQPIETAYVKVI